MIAIQPADAALFKAPTGGSILQITLEDRRIAGIPREIVSCTARSGTNLTVIRGQEGTTKIAFRVGATVSARLTAAMINGLQNQAPTSQAQYLGAFSSAPTATSTGQPLQFGMLYFNTTSGGLFEYSTASVWVAVAVNSQAGAAGIFLGTFSTPPTVRNDFTALQVGDSYYNSLTGFLNTWSGSAWVPAANVNTINGNVTIQGNLQIAGSLQVSGSITAGSLTVSGGAAIANGVNVTGGITADSANVTGTFVLDGLPLVSADQISGTSNTQNFPDGTIMQCGSGVFGTNVVFPRPYITTIDSILVTKQAASGARQGTSFVLPTGLTGFLATSYDSDGRHDGDPFFWQSWGK
jgi:hypothetical protein